MAVARKMIAKVTVMQVYRLSSDPMGTTCHYRKICISQRVGKNSLWLLWSLAYCCGYSLNGWETFLQTLSSYSLSCSGTVRSMRQSRNGERFTFKVKAAPFEIWWLLCQGTAFTLKASLFHFCMVCITVFQVLLVLELAEKHEKLQTTVAIW